ncbi:MAG: hypothetical protein K2O01_07315 [Bacteroidales bacterium]|nr:hypothetical protein [Bacteroidales bacterium]
MSRGCLWIVVGLFCLCPAVRSAETKRPESLLHRADSLSLYYLEELYHDPTLADSFTAVQADLRQAFAKPARFVSLEAAWETALDVLERIPDGTAEFAETAGFVARQMGKARPEQALQARLAIWKILNAKGFWPSDIYRAALRSEMATGGLTDTGYRADVCLALAETYRFTQPDSAHFYATLASGGTKETDSASVANSRLLLNSLEAPFFSVSGMHVYAPERPLLWSVCAKNVKRLPYRIFLVPADDRMNFLSGMMPFDRYAAGKQAVREGLWTLTDFPQDYREYRTELYLSPLPAGTYLLAVDNKVFLPFQVSGLAFIDFGTVGFTASRITGKPLSDVTLDVFTAEYDYVSHLNRYARLGDTRRSGADGFVEPGEPTDGGTEMEKERRRLNRFFLFRHGEDSLIRTFVRPPFAVWNNTPDGPDENDTLAGVHFFLDLPVYKAGDSVRLKGVLWARRAGKGAPFLMAGRQLTLWLDAPDPIGRRGRNRPAADETPGVLYVETDSLGGFTGGFRLPAAATAGLWRLRARLIDPNTPGRRTRFDTDSTETMQTGRTYFPEDNALYFRVEAYRPPQFEIRMVNRDSAVWGQVVALDGQALSGGNVRIDVRLLSDGFPVPRAQGAATEEKTWQASLTTDADGCFLLPTDRFTYMEDELSGGSPEGGHGRNGGYHLTCTVTDLSGEMQTASLWLPLQSQAWRAELIAPARRLAQPSATDDGPAVATAPAAQTTDTFKLFVRDAAGEKRTADYRLTVYRLTDTLPDRAFDRRFPEPDLYTIPLDTFLLKFPDEPYFTDQMRQACTKRRAVFTHSGRDTVLTADLPDGRYAYTVWILHPRLAGRTDSCTGFFTLGRQPLVPTLYARLSADSLHLHWTVPEASRRTTDTPRDTTYNATHLYFSIENRHGKTRQGYLPLKADTTLVLSGNANGSEGFGFAAEDDLNILLAYVCGGRLFQQSLYRAGQIAETPLELTIDRLPDSSRTHATETLRVHVARGGQSAADIPLTLALYDDALHTFAPGNWFSGRPPRIVPPVTPRPFNRHFYGYDPIWFTQDAAYTSPDAYRFDRLDRGGRRPTPPGIRMLKSLNADETAMEDQGAANAYSSGTGATTASGTEPAMPLPRAEQPASVLFFPTLRSDAEGHLQLPFELPAAPGRYRWAIAAYDRDLQAAYATQTIQAVQDYRLTWQLPRFLSAGDSVRFSAKANRLNAAEPQTARILWEIADTRFEETLVWAAGEADKRLTSPTIYSPQDSGTLTVRLYLSVATTASTAETASFRGDALSARIPVLSDRIYLREHIPFYIRPGRQITLTLPKPLSDALKKSPSVDTVFYWPADPTRRIELLCRELTLDSTDHAYNALLHYLKTRLLHNHKSVQTANAYKKLCRFLTPDDGFCWLQGQPTDPVLSLVIAEALAADAFDDYDVRNLLRNDLLPYIEHAQAEATSDDNRAAAPDSLPSAARLRFLFTAALAYGHDADRYVAAYAKDLQSFCMNVNRYPIREGVYGLYALHLHGDTALFESTWRHYRQSASYNEETGLSWRKNDMGRSQGERLKTASLVYRLSRSRNDYPTAAAASRWLGQQNRTTDLLSAAAVRPMDVLTLAYNEWLFPLPTWRDKTPATWKLQGRKLTIDWREAAATTQPGAAIPDSAAALFGTYGALTFGYTQKLSAVAASPAADLTIELLTPERLSQGGSPTLQLRIESKRPASYVRVRFGRPGGSEYGTTRAGFVYKNGLAFYENIRETDTELLIPFLPAGRYLFSYPLNAQTVGRFALPPATIETLLDPADSFSAHSHAPRIRISE